MKEYEEVAYEAQYKTGCETPVRTNPGERKPTNLVAFFSLYTVFHPGIFFFQNWAPITPSLGYFMHNKLQSGGFEFPVCLVKGVPKIHAAHG
jgi:hypothetical protein